MSRPTQMPRTTMRRSTTFGMVRGMAQAKIHTHHETLNIGSYILLTKHSILIHSMAVYVGSNVASKPNLQTGFQSADWVPICRLGATSGVRLSDIQYTCFDITTKLNKHQLKINAGSYEPTTGPCGVWHNRQLSRLYEAWCEHSVRNSGLAQGQGVWAHSSDTGSH